MRSGAFCLLFALVFLGASCGSNEANQAENNVEDSASSNADEPISLTISTERYLDELNAQEWEQVCTWMVDVQGGPHSVECSQGVTITVETVAECSQRTDFPHCTVGLLVDCVAEQAKDLCQDAPVECDRFYDCVYAN